MDKNQKSALDLWLKKKKKTKPKGIENMPEDAVPVLSYGQERIWLAEQLYPNAGLYNYIHNYELEGKVNLDLLTSCFEDVANRHDVIRSNYVNSENHVVQVINENFQLPVETYDLSSIEATAKEERVSKLTDAIKSYRFDLTSSSLIRLYYIQLSASHTKLIVVMHHILGDAASLDIINSEVSRLYLNDHQQIDAEIIKPAIQYRDFAFHQRNKEADAKSQKYWKDKFEDQPSLLDLPIRNKDNKNPFLGHSLKSSLSVESTAKLDRFTKEQSVTTYSLLLTVFKILLSRYVQSSDIVVATPFSNRDHKVLERLVGFFNETVAIRTTIAASKSFKTLLALVQQQVMEGMQHKSFPIDLLVKALNTQRSSGENPLFNTMFLYGHKKNTLNLGADIKVTEGALDTGISKFDLTLFANETEAGIELVFEYNSGFDKNVISSISSHFENLLNALIDNPDHPIKNIEFLSDQEKNLLLNEWGNSMLKSTVDNTSVLDLISEHATTSPDRLAVSFGETTLSYRQLDEQSSWLAAQINGLKTAENQFIGLYTHRSVEMIVGIIGILKAGHAYVPLDPDYPVARINFVLSDANIDVVVTNKGSEEKNQFEKALEIITLSSGEFADRPTEKIKAINPDNNAYLIYTSGSTGKPKGVPVSHRNLLSSTKSRFDFYQQQPESFLLLSSFSFDSSVAGIFWTLCNGGTIVLPPNRIEQDIDQLSVIIKEKRVTHTLMLPSLYATLLSLIEPQHLASMKTVIVAGESCSATLRELHFEKNKGALLYNEYGPTEATVWCIAHEIKQEEAGIVPIGKPISNSAAYILDRHKNLVPVGIDGELHIGGIGVTQGYLNRPELTKEKFIKNPFAKGNLYGTGDSVRFDQNGNLIFNGRVDEQVKIRGFRIEPGEIEKVIVQHEAVTQTVVTTAIEGNQTKLIAYVCCSQPEHENDIRKSVARALPSHMVPASFIFVKTFPTLPNGKVDLNQLKQLKAVKSINETFAKPENEEQSIIKNIWETVLHTENIGIDDNFFDVGGDSISSIRIITAMRNSGFGVSPTALFDHQTIRSLENHAQRKRQENADNKERLLSYPVKTRLPHQHTAFLFHHLQAKDDQGFLHLQFTIEGTIEMALMSQAWQHVSTIHPVLKTSFHWPENEDPFQLIHEEANLTVLDRDLSSLASDLQLKEIVEYKAEDRAQKLKLQSIPNTRIQFFKVEEKKHILVWSIHHISLDGWSAAIVLRDLLTVYNCLNTNSNIELTQSPLLPDYILWMQEQSTNEAEHFWKSLFRDQQYPLLSDYSKINTHVDYREETLILDLALCDQLRAMAQHQRFTLHTLLQGAWLIALGQYFNTDSVSTGVTVTGRSSDFPNIERFSGLMMNVLPICISTEEEMTVKEWFDRLQKINNELRKFEFVETSQVEQWIEQKDNRRPTDNLFVYGNFMADDEQIGSLRITDFEGDFSSTFPLAIRLNPLKQIVANVQFDTSHLATSEAKWLVDRFISLLQDLTRENTWSAAGSLRSSIDHPVYTEHKRSLKKEALEIQNDFEGPSNAMELEISKIWSRILNISSIDRNEDFFELGGSSISAIQMLNEISDSFDKTISPAVFFNYASISKLAGLLSGNKKPEAWSMMVPMKIDGDRNPLFCIHSGGAHVMFYKGIAKYMSSDRPVYAIQPAGINGDMPYDDSIANMAGKYIREIKKVQPQGPYYILGTCFSNAVGLEIVHQLKAKNDTIGCLIVVDSAPAYTEPPSLNGEKKPVSRMFNMIKDQNWSGISKKLKNRLNRQRKKLSLKEESAIEKNLNEMIDSLNTIYANYTWRPVDERITLIRSSEFSKRKDKNFHLTQWKKLTQTELEIHEVEGHHLTLFEEPEVSGLARAIASHLNSLGYAR